MDALFTALESTVDELLQDACPCRFPRFRAVVAMDTSRSAGGSFTTGEKPILIGAFERKVPILDRGPLGPYPTALPQMWQGTCGRCGSGVERSSNEFAPGGWVDYLSIRRAKGLVDVGAPIEGGRVFRATGFQSPGPGMEGLARAAQVYPFIGIDEFVRWLRARA
ncbi:MAG: hypothetical protein NVSMB47_04550 [Polyangiales bacterium]